MTKDDERKLELTGMTRDDWDHKGGLRMTRNDEG